MAGVWEILLVFKDAFDMLFSVHRISLGLQERVDSSLHPMSAVLALIGSETCPFPSPENQHDHGARMFHLLNAVLTGDQGVTQHRNTAHTGPTPKAIKHA